MFATHALKALNDSEASVADAQQSSRILVEVSIDSLQLERYTAFVADPGAGAIATFSGVTKDSFQGKAVLKLEYEAYAPMAEKVMQDICMKAANKWDVRKLALAHKIGLCGVGETSVIIAVSSAHRREALEACHWLIDELKAVVPIWKKEFFEDGEVWKENAEAWRKAQAAA